MGHVVAIAEDGLMEMWRVIWEIDIEAATAEEAAGEALVIMRDNDPANTATVFSCTNRKGMTELVDLYATED